MTFSLFKRINAFNSLECELTKRLVFSCSQWSDITHTHTHTLSRLLKKGFCCFRVVQRLVLFSLVTPDGTVLFTPASGTGLTTCRAADLNPALFLFNNICGCHTVCAVCVSPSHRSTIDSLSVSPFCFSLERDFSWLRLHPPSKVGY